ncbi:MAG: hypothetical protein ACHQ6T_19405 [Myxococcota bacterium]
MLRWLVAAAALLAALAAGTWWALESSGVALLRTQRPDGSLRTTHVWYADSEGVTWVEAANPQRDFVADLRRYPELLLKRDGAEGGYRAEVSRAPEDHARVRALLREKYGWRDVWVGLVADTSHSLAVKLHRLGP